MYLVEAEHVIQQKAPVVEASIGVLSKAPHILALVHITLHTASKKHTNRLSHTGQVTELWSVLGTQCVS